jgi:hypothetical protein
MRHEHPLGVRILLIHNPKAGIGEHSQKQLTASRCAWPSDGLSIAEGERLEELLKAGYAVRVLDNLAPQVQTLASMFPTGYIL